MSKLKRKRARPGTRKLTNADYRRRYKKRHPKRVKKQHAANYARHRVKKLKQAKARHARNRDPFLITPTQEDTVKLSPQTMQRARELHAIQFKRAVLERIEREREERVAKPVAVLNAERDALIATLNACGRSVAFIADAVRVTVKHVRTVLSIVPKVKPSRPVQIGLFPMEGLRHG